MAAQYVESEPGEPVVEARELHLLTACADDVDASISESDDAVRIDDITGDQIDGDCLGGVRLSLSQPIGDRALFVDGTQWRLRQGNDCPDGRFAPPDANESMDCEPVP